MDILKIATWNLCLGLANKRDIVTQTLSNSNISACCVQETEIPMNYPEDILNCNDYNLELEINNLKKRTGIYLRKNVKYLRRKDLEIQNCHIVIIDIFASQTLRLIGVYRSFMPQDSVTPAKLFEIQLGIIGKALTNNCYIMGDFNLDARMEGRPDYDRKVPLNILMNFALEKNLIQIITETTWSRVINGIKKESVLDHVFVANVASVINVSYKPKLFGDHTLVVVDLIVKPLNVVKSTTNRNWSNYNSVNIGNVLSNKLSPANSMFYLSVQEHWNYLENVLINTIDEICPLVTITHKLKSFKMKTPRNISHKINRRKRLLRTDRKNNSKSNHVEIRNLNQAIKKHYASLKIGDVRKACLGVNGNLWKAVKIAKNLVPVDLPDDLNLGGVPVSDVANSFAKHFHDKILLNVNKTNVNANNVYNGKCKLIVQNRNFMLKSDVKE